MYHQAVLLHESVEGMNLNAGSIAVDVTFGGGGHSREILSHLDSGHLYAFDQDAEAQANIFEDERFTFIGQNFKYLKNFLRFHGAAKVDAILADLGVSSHQFDKAERGFSIRFDAELDLRMDTRQPLSAKEIVNNYPYEKLKEIFKLYGELPNAAKLASAICKQRELSPINTTFELKSTVEKLIPRNMENKFLAMIFQALRIEVNEELEALKSFLTQSLDVLKPGGRLVVISYHSLEDRLVKNFMKTGNFEGNVEKDFYGNLLTPFNLVSRKPIVPSDAEVAGNNRARSAKLRIAEKR